MFKVIKGSNGFFRFRKQSLPAVRQNKPIADTVKQYHIVVFFNLRYRLTDCGLGNI